MVKISFDCNLTIFDFVKPFWTTAESPILLEFDNGEFIVEDPAAEMCIFGNQTVNGVRDISTESCDVYLADIEAKENINRNASRQNGVLHFSAQYLEYTIIYR